MSKESKSNMNSHFSIATHYGLTLFSIALLICLASCVTPSPTPLPTSPAPPPIIATQTPTFVAPTPAPIATHASSNDVLPIFDTHAHYSRNSWSLYSPQDILNKLANANVMYALISSSYDEGTRRLYELDPVRIVPGLRPYHDDVTTTNWETSSKTLPYLEERIDDPIYATLGEIHVHVQNIESPILREAIQLALERNLVLHIHSDAETLRAVLKIAPDAKILWAHAGLIESPETVSQVLSEFPNVSTDVAIREYSIAPNGKLSDEWRALFLKHPDRITIGSDTWIPERWTGYEKIIEHHRAWLNQLPRDVAEKIAYRNALKLFSMEDAGELQK